MALHSFGIEQTPWTAYTPTISASTGALGTVATPTGRYKVLGKTVVFNARAAITTNGTGGGYLIIGLPVQCIAGNQFIFSAMDETTGAALTGLLYPSTSQIAFRLYTTAGGYPGVDGHAYDVTGVYEAA